MGRMRCLGGLAAASLAVGTLVLLAVSSSPPAAHVTAVAPGGATRHWAQEGLTRSARFRGEVPLPVTRHTAAYLRPHPLAAEIRLNFGFPIRDKAALDRLIQRQAQTHAYISRDELYARFSP